MHAVFLRHVGKEVFKHLTLTIILQKSNFIIYFLLRFCCII